MVLVLCVFYIVFVKDVYSARFFVYGTFFLIIRTLLKAATTLIPETGEGAHAALKENANQSAKKVRQDNDMRSIFHILILV